MGRGRGLVRTERAAVEATRAVPRRRAARLGDLDGTALSLGPHRLPPLVAVDAGDRAELVEALADVVDELVAVADERGSSVRRS
jgi:hypothetical protein